jgi:hypothetical protein
MTLYLKVERPPRSSHGKREVPGFEPRLGSLWRGAELPIASFRVGFTMATRSRSIVGRDEP